MRNRLCKPEISPGVCHGERRQAAVLCTCFSLQLCNFGSWQGEIVPAGVCAPRKDRRLRRLTMRNHLCKPEVSPGGCNGERRQAAALSACKKLRCVGSVRVWQQARAKSQRQVAMRAARLPTALPDDAEVTSRASFEG